MLFSYICRQTTLQYPCTLLCQVAPEWKLTRLHWYYPESHWLDSCQLHCCQFHSGTPLQSYKQQKRHRMDLSTMEGKTKQKHHNKRMGEGVEHGRLSTYSILLRIPATTPISVTSVGLVSHPRHYLLDSLHHLSYLFMAARFSPLTNAWQKSVQALCNGGED